MPGDYCLRSHHKQRRAPTRPELRQPHPEHAIDGTEVRTAFLRPSKDYDLVAQGDDLRLKLQTALKPGTKEGKQKKDWVAHGERRV
jgi:hypothetical protein